MRRLLKPLETPLKRKRSVHPVVLLNSPYIVTQAGSSDGIEFLNAQEEYALVKLYVDKIPPLCTHFRFNDEVESTAMTYLKRFYLNNTAMDWHPKNVMWVSRIAILAILILGNV
jgi:cyclin H